MATISKLVHACILLACCWHFASCHKGEQQTAKLERGDICPPSPSPRDSVIAVRADSFPIELQLPVGAYQPRDLSGDLGPGQAWTATSGLVVSYVVHRAPIEHASIGRGDQNVFECCEAVGEHWAAIRSVYSIATTVPGQYVTSVVELDGDESLVVRAFHPDSSHKEQLLGIARSLPL